MQTDLATPACDKGLLALLFALGRRFGLSPAFVKFLAVGAAAYAVNQVALLLLYDGGALPLLPAKDSRLDFALFTHPDSRLLLASVLAVEVTIVFKFFALEHWTFRDRERRGWMPLRFLRFNAACALPPAITVGTVNTLTPIFGISPYISNTIGTLLGFAVNYAISAYIIWPHRREDARAHTTYV